MSCFLFFISHGDAAMCIWCFYSSCVQAVCIQITDSTQGRLFYFIFSLLLLKTQIWNHWGFRSHFWWGKNGTFWQEGWQAPFSKIHVSSLGEERDEKGRGKKRKREERESNQGCSQERSQCCLCFMVCLFIFVPLLWGIRIEPWVWSQPDKCSTNDPYPPQK